MATREASPDLKCPAGASDDVGVKQRDEILPELYAGSQESAEEAPEAAAESASEDSAATLTLTELADEAPGLYGEAELRAAVERESYGIEVSEQEREESADPSGAISLPSCDSDAESLRICLVADTLDRK
jgi:hypothetical protein